MSFGDDTCGTSILDVDSTQFGKWECYRCGCINFKSRTKCGMCTNVSPEEGVEHYAMPHEPDPTMATFNEEPPVVENVITLATLEDMAICGRIALLDSVDVKEGEIWNRKYVCTVLSSFREDGNILGDEPCVKLIPRMKLPARGFQ